MSCTRSVFRAIVRCPIGQLHLSACDSGLHGIRLDESIIDENFAPVDEQPVVLVKLEDGDESAQPIAIKVQLKPTFLPSVSFIHCP